MRSIKVFKVEIDKFGHCYDCGFMNYNAFSQTTQKWQKVDDITYSKITQAILFANRSNIKYRYFIIEEMAADLSEVYKDAETFIKAAENKEIENKKRDAKLASKRKELALIRKQKQLAKLKKELENGN